MKSLEILEHIKNAPSFMGGDDRYKNNIQSHWVFLEDIETIKQDLEVLEILKEHLVLIPTGTNKEQLFIASDITNYLSEKDKEDFHKVKQWLEEN